ncbi:rod shape-determining protein MreD [Neisseria perflava]|uniref:rod shape-determining protein MreD n=1 Tax=Neisseria perflava TaxID=33053 RepID=UPI0020A132EF|nr:rod shape-determining protein MreD [Neisseria perflava]MCP1771232.1 rod shape-determining protein MreD [Neisseria perflava]
MSDFDDSFQIMPWHVIIGSFVVAMLLDFMPFPFDVFFWLPELTALTLLYWSMHCPQRVGLGVAFIVGLLADVGTAASLGLHALSYTVMVFFILNRHRQIMLYGHVMQIFVILAALLCNQAVLVVARLFLNHQIITWQSFIAPFVGALIWPLLSQLLLVITRSYRNRR